MSIVEKPTQDIKDDVIRQHIKHLQEEGMSGDIKQVDGVPTTETLKPQDGWVHNGSGRIYVNLGGTIYYGQLVAAQEET